MIVLAGDIGGTNIRLALFSDEVGTTAAMYEAVYPSCDFNSLSEVLLKFLSKNEEHIEAAAFVLAGPVVDDQVVITNLGWIASEAELNKVLGDIPIEFYNDLAGLTNFIVQVQPPDLVVLKSRGKQGKWGDCCDCSRDRAGGRFPGMVGSRVSGAAL